MFATQWVPNIRSVIYDASGKQMKRCTRWEIDTFCPRGGANIKIPFKEGKLKVSKYITGMEIQ